MIIFHRNATKERSFELEIVKKQEFMNNKQMKKITLITLLFLVSCINPNSYENKAKIVESMATSVTMENKDIPFIEAKDLMFKMTQKSYDSIVVDARSESEQLVSMIPGAVPKHVFDKNKENFKDKEIFTYCTIGARSSAYARELIKNGFKATSLKGGVLSWAQAGGIFDNGGVQTKKVKFLNDAWNILPEGYEGVTP
ncbi:rhodanese-like protein [Bacteriovorax sp. DB6_IX]|nr:rhodanese-like protein [Bacteriovorax sp. DB6_IX]